MWKWNNEEAILDIFKPKVIWKSWWSSAGKSEFAQSRVLLTGISWGGIFPGCVPRHAPSNLFIHFLDYFLEVAMEEKPRLLRSCPLQGAGFLFHCTSQEKGDPLHAGELRAVQNYKTILGFAPLVLLLHDPRCVLQRHWCGLRH